MRLKENLLLIYSLGRNSVYVFKNNGTSFIKVTEIKNDNSESDDGFGNGSDIDGDNIIIGATGDDSNQKFIINGTSSSTNNSSSNSGAVYVYKF